MKTHVPIKIITCPQWGAVEPRHPIEHTSRPAARIIFHHTAGHHAEISNPQDESVEEAMRFARDIQTFHMGPQRGWNDSGHNFLVCRNGAILQGRWLTVSAIEEGRMVVSAHCPGYNDQIGIEHEHIGTEMMTDLQMESSATLQAWIAGQYGRVSVLSVDPHSAHFPTSCPANLKADIPKIRARAIVILSEARRGQ